MTTPTPIRSVFRLAIGLLIVLVVGAWQMVSMDAAQGVLMGGVLMLASFAMGGLTVRRVSQAAEAGMTSGAAGLTAIKIPVLIVAIWMLLKHFDPIPVVVGGSVVMVAIVLQAALEILHPTPEKV